MKNLGNLMKQAQEMQAKMEAMQRDLKESIHQGRAGAGLVTVTMNGKNEVKAVKIDPSAVDPSQVEVLEDLIAAAFGDAKAKVEAHQKAEMLKLTGGLDLPAGFKMPF
ncbi:MAG: YbaB/EbfC family nucleoid-associated protein [Rhodospirillaceae bacterium]|nr:YbaB/EbfC family nucleoid-associated protein [Rhodospirillaceae bacterium]MCY4311759.1 YbaB/EbfC family nucleoid-associated protein [Rhodospirillaceae bacterium]